MGQQQELLPLPLGRAALIAAVLALGSGCIHVHTDADGKPKSVEMKLAAPDAKPAKPEGGVKTADVRAAKPDGAVKPAAAAVPAPITLPSLPKLGPPPAGHAANIAVTWQNRIAYLPDPTKNGSPGAGIVGQMFLFTDALKFAPADGKLTITMYNESNGKASDVALGSWVFDKETLRRLVAVDERFGKSYALFLPWPDYKPDVTRVKLTVRYDPDHGYPLFAEPSSLTIDTTATSPPPGSGPLTPLAPPAPPSAAQPTPPPIPLPARSAGVSPTGLPPGLPPIVMTAPPGR